MKINLTDVTFIIPIRVDSIIRLENLKLTVELIDNLFETNIVVLEASAYNNHIIQTILQDKISYIFIEDKDPVFHKTKYLNIMARQVDTNLVGIWDVDVIIDPAQILDSVTQLRSNKYDIAYPYDGEFLDTSDVLRNHYIIHRNIEYLTRHKNKMISLYTVEGVIGAVGGAIFAKTEKYLLAGMENEEFYGWGLEDGERHYRWLCFDFTIYRSEGCLFHLTHPRDSNGIFRSKSQQNKALHDMNEVVDHTKEELCQKFSSDRR